MRGACGAAGGSGAALPGATLVAVLAAACGAGAVYPTLTTALRGSPTRRLVDEEAAALRAELERLHDSPVEVVTSVVLVRAPVAVALYVHRGRESAPFARDAVCDGPVAGLDRSASPEVGHIGDEEVAVGEPWPDGCGVLALARVHLAGSVELPTEHLSLQIVCAGERAGWVDARSLRLGELDGDAAREVAVEFVAPHPLRGWPVTTTGIVDFETLAVELWEATGEAGPDGVSVGEVAGPSSVVVAHGSEDAPFEFADMETGARFEHDPVHDCWPYRSLDEFPMVFARRVPIRSPVPTATVDPM